MMFIYSSLLMYEMLRQYAYEAGYMMLCIWFMWSTLELPEKKEE